MSTGYVWQLASPSILQVRRLDYECFRESMLGSDFTGSNKRGHLESEDHLDER